MFLVRKLRNSITILKNMTTYNKLPYQELNYNNKLMQHQVDRNQTIIRHESLNVNIHLHGVQFKGEPVVFLLLSLNLTKKVTILTVKYNY